jgi:hypothetical protein
MSSTTVVEDEASVDAADGSGPASMQPNSPNTWVVLSENGTRNIDLSPIIAFETQESDDLDRLMDEHAAKVDERAQLFDLMREAAYTDPIIHIVKRCLRQQVETAIKQHHMAKLRQRVRHEQQRMQASQEAAAGLLRDEEEAQVRARDRLEQKAKEQQRRVEERQQAELKARKQLAAIDRKIKQQELEAEAKKQQLEQDHRKQVEAAVAYQEEQARKLFQEQRQAQLDQNKTSLATARSAKPIQPPPTEVVETPATNSNERATERSSKRTSRRNRARAKARATADPAVELAQPTTTPSKTSSAPVAAQSNSVNRMLLTSTRVRTTSASAPTSPQQHPEPQQHRPASYTGTKASPTLTPIAPAWAPAPGFLPRSTPLVDAQASWSESTGLNGGAAPFVPGLAAPAPVQAPLYGDWSVSVGSELSAWGDGLLSAYPTSMAPDTSMTDDADSQALPNVSTLLVRHVHPSHNHHE